ncbi:hypothetical protein BKA82DRAFT_4143446 [Pisolithus tinctorius]|nr:hypothetical protein BKA82DRAFT_4143446 [Pisolithus tinctorius]
MACAGSSKTPSRPRTREIIDPTYPLLEANRSAIESIRRETFTYGSSDVHKDATTGFHRSLSFSMAAD